MTNQSNSQSMLSWFVLTVALLLLGCPCCGYKVRSSVGNLPAGIKSLGVPTFRNSTNQYKVEQQISSAVLKELTTRTRIPVNSSKSGVDAVLLGEVTSVSSTPVTFGTNSFASAFLVTVQMTVKLVRTSDSKVLWENNDFLFRERYVLNSQLQDFFSEENPALDRLSREFASSLVSSLLSGSAP